MTEHLTQVLRRGLLWLSSPGPATTAGRSREQACLPPSVVEATAAGSYLRGSRSREVVLTQLSLPSPLVFWFKISVFPRITLNSEQFCLCLLSAEMCEAPCLAPFSPLIQSQPSRPWEDAIRSQGEVPPALSLLWKHRHRHTQSVPPWFPRPCLPSPVKLMIKGRI